MIFPAHHMTDADFSANHLADGNETEHNYKKNNIKKNSTMIEN